jgi:hypothetical protein
MNRIQLAAALAGILGAAVYGQERPRVFVSDSHSWEMRGGFGVGDRGRGGGSFSGGARPQTVEIMKTFRERCPEVIVTLEKDRADFVVLLDHEGGKRFLRDNKVAVFNSSGDLIVTSSTRVLGNAVKDACRAIVGTPGS